MGFKNIEIGHKRIIQKNYRNYKKNMKMQLSKFNLSATGKQFYNVIKPVLEFKNLKLLLLKL